MKILTLLSSVTLAAACGPHHPAATGPAPAPDAATPPAAPLGAMTRADLLQGDWAVAGEATPVVFLHPAGGLSAVYGVVAASVPIVLVVDDTPPDVTPDGRHLELFRYQGDRARDCEEQPGAGEGLTFGCEDGAGGVRLLPNGQALDVEEWTATAGPDTTHLVPADPAPAPALEDADRAFAADTAARGADGWVAAYAADGVEWQGVTALRGKDAIRADIAASLEAGDLTWAPTVSRMLVAGALGVTAGVFTFTPHDGGAASHGTYLTLWRKDATGWKVLLDTGRPDK